MSDGKRKQINHAKNELKNYMYLLNVVHGFEGKILKVTTELEGVRSPSAPFIPGSSFQSPELRKAELYDKLETYQSALASFRYRTERIGSFLDGLEYTDRKMITDVYINNDNMERVARKNAYSREGLKWRIDELLKDF